MNILLIAYYFPPLNTGGTMRPVKTAKYLRKLGHQVTILTHTYGKNQLTPDDKGVIRIKDISFNKNRGGGRKFVWLLLRGWTEILNRLGIYHSIYSWWKQRVLKYGKYIIEIVQPDIILATYPPVETLEIGTELSKLYKIPLVSDFRDGLLFEPIEEKRMNRYTCIRETYKTIEQEALTASQLVITASEPISRYFRETYPDAGAETVFNGYDDEDFTFANSYDKPRRNIREHKGESFDSLTKAGEPAVKNSFEVMGILAPEKVNILHTGRFSLSDAGAASGTFFQVLRELTVEKPELLNEFHVHLVGDLSTLELKEIQDLLTKDVVTYYGMMDRALCLKLQKKADLLLLVTQLNRCSVVSTKLFEYLRSGSPILALTHKTVAAHIVREGHAGWVSHPGNNKEIRDVLEHFISTGGPAKALLRDEEVISALSTEEQIKNLNRIFKATFKQES
ncbi:MAG: glycosyltransferase family 4 protein [bacterium]|nr:glycosyltransferase family 4 protein [bacterium]